ncbi:MAG: hypothetical protein Q7T84_11315, partial [Phenylobacterium sp.]|uniref:DAPG hydrolase family protein n=1 Tax=Phenylobacterium sp. TaxID=1871053 RepID=UPI002727CBE4
SHAYAGVRDGHPGDHIDPTDRSGWQGNVSYVDEVIGGQMDQLAIAPQDPARYGIDLARFDGTAVVGTVGTVFVPVNVGLACHQIRRTSGGSEMRSRFYLNVLGVRSPDPIAALRAVRRGVAETSKGLGAETPLVVAAAKADWVAALASPQAMSTALQTGKVKIERGDPAALGAFLDLFRG